MLTSEQNDKHTFTFEVMSITRLLDTGSLTKLTKLIYRHNQHSIS